MLMQDIKRGPNEQIKEMKVTETITEVIEKRHL